MDKVGNQGELLELCARAAERCGDDELCEFYATKGVDHYAGGKPSIAACCRAVLGRAAGRRGDRNKAETHWRAAAEQALAAKDPLLVLRVAQDWGGQHEEPNSLVLKACAVLGRDPKVVQTEF